jgi:hypothetical protein
LITVKIFEKNQALMNIIKNALKNKFFKQKKLFISIIDIKIYKFIL